jgi:hypothetical protein
MYFLYRPTKESLSANEFKMARAELVNIDMAGKRVGCAHEEIERVKQASRIEYARNLIACERWDEAAQLLQESMLGLAPRWLSLTGLLRMNRLARINFVQWLQSVDRKVGSYECSGDCSLPEAKRMQCMESCRKPYFLPSKVG